MTHRPGLTCRCILLAMSLLALVAAGADDNRTRQEREERKDGKVEEKFGGFNKVVFEGKKEKRVDLGEIAWESTITIDPPTFETECQAALSISYTQMYDRVRVDTTIDHEGCPVSSGDYMVRLRTRSDGGEINDHQFDESWSRREPGPIEIRKDYPLGGDPDLVWARVQTRHASNCRCDALSDETAGPVDGSTPP